MTELEIVLEDAKKNNSQYPIEAIIGAYEHVKSDPTTSVLRHGDSMLLIEQLDKTHFHFHFINAARSYIFIENVKILMCMAKKMGITEMVTDFTNPKVIDIAEQTNFDFDIVEYKDQFIMTVRL